jgi:hypothetical protein
MDGAPSILLWLVAARLKPGPCYKASFGFVVSHPCREETAAWMGHPALSCCHQPGLKKKQRKDFVNASDLPGKPVVRSI